MIHSCLVTRTRDYQKFPSSSVSSSPSFIIDDIDGDGHCAFEYEHATRVHLPKGKNVNSLSGIESLVISITTKVDSKKLKVYIKRFRLPPNHRSVGHFRSGREK